MSTCSPKPKTLTLAGQLEEALSQIKENVALIAKNVERHHLVKEKYHTQRDAIIAGVELILEEMSLLMSAYGLTPPELPIDGGLKIPKFFLLALRACLC